MHRDWDVKDDYSGVFHSTEEEQRKILYVSRRVVQANSDISACFNREICMNISMGRLVRKYRTLVITQNII